MKIFIAVQAALYASFLWLDMSGADGSKWIKYASIVLCLGFSVFLSARGGEKLVTAAMCFTLAADTFLLLLDTSYAAGVALFCVVQALYFVRIYRANGRRSALSARFVLLLAAVAALWILDMLSPLNLLAALYFTTFLCNAAQSLSIKNALFSAGLILFLCCDICVGVHNAPELFPAGLSSFADIGMWLFYLPSQVLITLSGRKADA
ncbi:MAG: lysoplasmalogenase family protein [Oscillospiraceae bacterium]